MASNPPQPLRIAIYAPNAYALLLSPDEEGNRLRSGRWFAPRVGFQEFGGIETRAVTLAKALAKRHDAAVTLVVENPAARRVATRMGIRVLGRPNLRRQASRSLYRYAIWKPTHWWRYVISILGRVTNGRLPDEDAADEFVSKIAADVFLVFGTNRQSASIVKSVDRSILSIAADADVAPELAAEEFSTTIYGEPATVIRDVIQRASTIAVQTNRQKQRLQQHFDRESELLPNPLDLNEWDRRAAKATISRKPRSVLWVGRADRDHKRPLLAIEAARSTPEWRWTMILGPGDDTVAEQLTRQLPTNVTLQPSVSFDEMPSLMFGHTVFVSTSNPESEGLPNVLLQAAASHLPIISMGAGREFCEAANAGVVVDSVSRVAATLNDGLTSFDPADKIHARRFVEEHHASDAIADRLMEIARKTVSQ